MLLNSIRNFRSLQSQSLSVMTAQTKVKAVLIDLSGTVHIDDTIIPGALQGIETLIKSGLVIKFVTNTTKESRHALQQRLRNIGMRRASNLMIT